MNNLILIMDPGEKWNVLISNLEQVHLFIFRYVHGICFTKIYSIMSLLLKQWNYASLFKHAILSARFSRVRSGSIDGAVMALSNHFLCWPCGMSLLVALSPQDKRESCDTSIPLTMYFLWGPFLFTLSDLVSKILTSRSVKTINM